MPKTKEPSGRHAGPRPRGVKPATGTAPGTRKRPARRPDLAFFSSVVEDLHCIAGLDGSLAYVNEAWERVLGFRRVELEAGRFFDYVHPDDRERTQEAVSRLRTRRRVIDFVNRYRCRDGSYRWLEWRAAVRGREIYATARDITGRRQAEEALRLSEERLRLAHKATNDVVWDWDIANDSQRWNEAGAVVFGWTEIVERPVTAAWWLERVHPDDRERVNRGFCAVLEDPQAFSWEDEYRFRRADGSYARVADHGFVMRDAGGQAARMVGAMQDISLRRQQEEALRASEAFRSLLLDTLPIPFFFKDTEGRYQQCNRAFESFLGTTRERIIGKSVFDVSPPERAMVYHAQDAVLFENVGTQIYESQVQTAQGMRDVVFHKASLTAGDGTIIGLIGVILDISDRRRAAEALQASEEKLHRLFDTMDQGVVYHGADGRITDANPAALRILGLSLEQILGRTSLDPRWRTVREDGSPFPGDQHPASVALRSGQPVRDVIMGVFHPGENETRWILVGASPLCRAGETIPFQAIATFTDITARMRAETALAEREFWLSESQRAGRIATYHLDIAADRWRCTPVLEEIFGIPPDYPRTVRSWDELVHPEQRKSMLAYFREEVIGKRQPFDREYRIRRPLDGQERWVYGRGELQLDEHGEPVAMIGTIQDVTGRKRVEEELRHSERRLRAIVDSAPFGAHIYQLDEDGRLVFVGANRAADAILGVDHQDFVGQTIEQAFPPLRGTRIPDAYRRVARGSGSYVADQVDYDGKTIRGAFEVHAVQIGPARMAAFFRDITERVRAEAALRESEAKYRHQASLLDMAHDAIVVRDLDDRIVYWNQGAERLYGWTAAETIGQGVRGRFFRDPSRFDEAKRRLLAEGEWSGEIQHLTRSGEEITVSSRWSLMRSADGQPEAVLVINTDVTQRKKLESQLLQAQKMEAIGRLAGGVAHDFNNLLTVILGFTQLQLMRDDLDPDARGNLQHILQAAEGASGLTRQLLAFSRKQVMQPRELDLNEVVNRQAHMLRRIIGEDISLSISASPRLPAIQADPGMVEQVVMNLAINARDAMPGGGQLRMTAGTVTLKDSDLASHPRGRPGAFVCLEVTDTGCGMPAEVLNQLFEPFFTTKEAGKGTGLGLATVYGIVEQHGGWVEVESRVDLGSTFRVFFPPLAGDRRDDGDQPAARNAGGGSETLLLAEDEAMVRSIARDYLTHLGYRVLEAESGPAALVLWAAHETEIDLLITDIVMPGGMSGPELAARLKRDRPGLGVIFSSGYSSEAKLDGLELREGENFLRKPFLLRGLAETVRRALDQKRES